MDKVECEYCGQIVERPNYKSVCKYCFNPLWRSLFNNKTTKPRKDHVSTEGNKHTKVL